MLNTTNIVNRSTTIVQRTVVPEKIDLNLHKKDDKSFFLEVDRDSEQYKKLLQENPVLLKREFRAFEEWEINCLPPPHNRLKRALGGEWVYVGTPINVLQVQYAGKNKFIFELKTNSYV